VPKVSILPDEITIEVSQGYALINLETDHDTSIEFCCKDASCGTCLIRVLEGSDNLSKMKEHERVFLDTLAPKPDERLACCCKVYGDIKIKASE